MVHLYHWEHLKSKLLWIVCMLENMCRLSSNHVRMLKNMRIRMFNHVRMLKNMRIRMFIHMR